MDENNNIFLTESQIEEYFERRSRPIIFGKKIVDAGWVISLTPHRKKENRNPRVKHRNKFRKALIRRKGAVRTVRKEIKRYDGEISGIKATVKKSIKLN